MTEQGKTDVEQISFGKGCVVAVICVVICMVFIGVGTNVLNLNNPWVGLLALTVWGTVYGSNIADLPKVWIGSAVGLLLGYLLWYLPSVMGPVAGYIVWFVLFIPLLGGFIAKQFPLICNAAALFILTVAVTSSQINNTHDHLLFFKDLAYGAVWFWLIPWGIDALIKMKKRAAASA